MPTLKLRSVYPALLAVCLLAACATPQNSANARPVLYPNAAYESMGAASANQVLNNCINHAKAQGLSASNQATAANAGKGAATAGVMAAVGALVTGGNGGDVLKRGAQGAAIGAAGGAVSGAYEEQYSPIYRRFVETCVAERGLKVLGWN